MAPKQPVTAAAEKVACPLKDIQSTLPIYKVVKSSAPKRRSKKFLLALQRPTAPPGKRYPVKILANGLVSVEATPDYLKAAIKRNSLESPLLRLPSKVRMKIWAYAMGGNAIEVKLRTAEDTSTSPSLFESNYLGYATIPGPSDRKTKKLRSAFHLPQTCRAIYRETAILGYALNTFVFNGEVPRMFGREDAPDSRSAITSIRPHWMDMLDYVHGGTERELKQLYPGLKEVVVAKRTVSAEANAPERGDPVRKLRRQQAKRRIVSRVEELEGEDVDVVF